MGFSDSASCEPTLPPHAWRCGEPLLDDVLDDPIVRAVMIRDGLRRDDVADAMQTARKRLDGTAKTPD